MIHFLDLGTRIITLFPAKLLGTCYVLYIYLLNKLINGKPRIWTPVCLSQSRSPDHSLWCSPDAKTHRRRACLPRGRRSGRPAPGRAAPSPTARERVSRCRPWSSHLHLLAAIYLVPTVLALRNLFKNRWPGPGRRLVPSVSSTKGTAQWGEESRDLWGRHVRLHARIPNTAHGSVDALCGPRTPAEAFPTAHAVCLPWMW